MQIETHWIELLIEGKYAQVDQGLNNLQSRFEERKITEDELYGNFEPFEALHNNRTDTSLALDKWVELYPESYAARLARGMYLAVDGHKRRGFDKSHRVEESQWQGMFESFEVARSDLHLSETLTNKPVLTYPPLMHIEMAGGGAENQDIIWSCYQKALLAHPISYRARTQYLSTIRAEWGGGTLEPMQKFLDDPTHKTLGEEKYKKLLAQRYHYEGHWFECFGSDKQKAFEAYSKAVETYLSSTHLLQRASIAAELGKVRQSMSDLAESKKMGYETASEQHEAAETKVRIAIHLFMRNFFNFQTRKLLLEAKKEGVNPERANAMILITSLGPIGWLIMRWAMKQAEA
jgi:hypothetical protein